MARRAAIAWALAVAGLAAGCDDDRGYVEIKTNYAIRPGDSYWIGERQVSPTPGGEIDEVLGVEVGTFDIYVRRGGSKIPLCGVTVTKNRIATVTIDRGPSGGVCNVVV
jgi:hypothetical protein